MNPLYDLAKGAVEGIIAGGSAIITDKNKTIEDALAGMEKIQNPGAFGDYADAKERARARVKGPPPLPEQKIDTLSDDDITDDGEDGA